MLSICNCYKQNTARTSCYSINGQNKPIPRVLETAPFSDLNIKWNDTIPFIPPIDSGLVIKVYDGDTITIASQLPYLNSPMYRFSVRLRGIDCPEIKSKNKEEIECAEMAKKVMSDLVLHKMVTIKNLGTEKYGRILADAYLGDLNLNDYMLKQKLAVPYDGTTKVSPKNWLNYYLTGGVDK
jgi:endonuclease YncB( thermonuclease family)